MWFRTRDMHRSTILPWIILVAQSHHLEKPVRNWQTSLHSHQRLYFCRYWEKRTHCTTIWMKKANPRAVVGIQGAVDWIEYDINRTFAERWANRQNSDSYICLKRPRSRQNREALMIQGYTAQLWSVCLLRTRNQEGGGNPHMLEVAIQFTESCRTPHPFRPLYQRAVHRKTRWILP